MNKLLKRIKNNWRKITIGAIVFIIASIMTLTNQNTPATNKSKTVLLTISGEVANPGVYEIRKGSSLDDNLHIFGGYTLRADLSKLNTSAPINKNTSINIKTKKGNDNINYDDLYSIPD
ncbi:MAG: SLBB domain-containing protein [Lachnospiraceae bacterium]|nr:SLBB domain-containing protein [Lachnospiraceae bacterium]